MSFQPEADFAEFHGQRVQVDAVDAVPNDVADGGSKRGGDGCSSPVRTMASSVAMRRAAVSRM